MDSRGGVGGLTQTVVLTDLCFAYHDFQGQVTEPATNKIVFG